MGLRRYLLTTAFVAMLMSACSPADEAGDSTTSTAESTTTIASDTTTITTHAVTTTTVPKSTTTSLETTTTTTLPGEPIDFGPREGDVLMVIGVAHDDQLNLRAAPGATQEILATIDPTYVGLIAQGETWSLPNAFWIKVDFEGEVGWVHMSFVGYQGLTDDLTSSVVSELGVIPTADTMVELGLIVAETQVSEEPSSDVVLVADETIGDLGEVTYDVIGFGDDAVRGLRLHVFGEPFEGGFSLKSVEFTTICGRDVDADGLCV